MQHNDLRALRRKNPAIRLMNADHMPLIASFANRVFLKTNRRSIPRNEAIGMLEDVLAAIGKEHGPDLYPRKAADYLEEWCDGRNRFFRKYYPDTADEPEIDLTPSTEQALEWLRGLLDRQFVGTESRLVTVMALLKSIMERAETDPAARIMRLEARKAAIDEEIERVRSFGTGPVDDRAIQERFLHVEEAGRQLLSDFRQIEENFRDLDRQTREQIALGGRAKGEVLDTIFGEQDAIADSPQGRSFKAFWEMLMAPDRQDDLRQMIEAVHELDPIRSLTRDDFLLQLLDFLLEAGSKVHTESGKIATRLRQFLSDRTYVENRRIMDLVQSIEKRAIFLKTEEPDVTMTLPAVAARVRLPMDRPLYRPPVETRIQDTIEDPEETIFDLSLLFSSQGVDPKRLSDHIREALKTAPAASLRQITEEHPVTEGLAEVVTYLHLAGRLETASMDDTETEIIQYPVSDTVLRKVRVPKVIFTRKNP